MNKAMFWDFDGTLVHANENFLCALRKALTDNGSVIAEDALRQFLQEACPWHQPQKDYSQTAGENWWPAFFVKVEALCKAHGVTNTASICTQFREHVIHYDYRPYADTAETLAVFQALGFRNYLLSNNYPELPDVVKRLGLDRYFSGYVISGQLGYEKPRREIFDHALKLAGFPQVCAMVGDNPNADVRGAEAAGIPAVLVHKTEDAMRCCAQLKDVRAALGF